MQRVVPILSKMLSAPALNVIADVIELDSLSESLDADMVAALAKKHALDESAFARAYRQNGRQDDRARQIVLIEHLGASLDTLSRHRFAGGGSRDDAQAHDGRRLRRSPQFLEKGYESFRKMRTAKPFLDAIVSQEKAFSAGVFAGDQ